MMRGGDMAGLDVGARVAAMFPAGTEFFEEWTSAGCRIGESEVDVLARRVGDYRLYGVPVPVEHTGHDFYYGSQFGVDSLEGWLESVDLGFMVMFGTGFFYDARRRVVEDYIELRQDGGWPEDDRFYVRPYAHHGRSGFVALTTDPHLDVSLPNHRLAQGRLLSWVIASENNVTAGPHLGQALVSLHPERGAVLELLEVTAGVPESVRLDLARFAVSESGPRHDTVTTDLEDPILAVLGFEALEDGSRRVGTDLLAADPDAARAMVEAEIKTGPLWGRDRDVSGRPLPSSRAGRFAHRVRWPISGRWHRTFTMIVSPPGRHDTDLPD